MREFNIRIKALTPIWTGDADRENTTLRETGIIGSLRWWYEALIRGLGGTACDRTNENSKCKLDHEKFKKALKEGKSIQDALSEQICLACQLFGCTGWSRKFIFHILDKDGNLKTTPIKKEEEVIFEFIPLKQIEDKEWVLLNLTLYFIAEYGALGGKTVFKPSDEKSRGNNFYHQDFGLIEIVESKLKMFKKEDLEKYAKDMRLEHINQEGYNWVSIKNFWCVKGKYLARKNYNESSFNKVLGRKEQKNQATQLVDPSNNISKWLAGSKGESKKIFSFKNPPRTFGFANPDIIDFNGIEERLKKVWGNENDWKLLKGDEILDSLTNKILETLK